MLPAMASACARNRRRIDLVVLDLMLSGEDGLMLAREVRQHSTLPIIMLTARSNPYDRVLGLESGADDYVSKPFKPRELVARIQTVLRRAGRSRDGTGEHTRSDVIRFDGWELHREDRCLTSLAGLVVALSNAEFRLLSSFLQMPRRLFSRDQLMEQARGRTMDSFERSIDLLVSRLRQKLADDPGERMRLKVAKRSESPTTLLEQFKRIYQQTVETGDGKTLTGLAEITPAKKSLFAALKLAPPTPANLVKPAL